MLNLAADLFKDPGEKQIRRKMKKSDTLSEISSGRSVKNVVNFYVIFFGNVFLMKKFAAKFTAVFATRLEGRAPSATTPIAQLCNKT